MQSTYQKTPTNTVNKTIKKSSPKMVLYPDMFIYANKTKRGSVHLDNCLHTMFEVPVNPDISTQKGKY